MAGAGICPLSGCADFTIPTGQVRYHSPVAHRTETMPVTINIVVKRGCDIMLYDMIERMAEVRMLQTVKAGKTAF